MLWDVGDKGNKSSGHSIFVIFMKENWICAMTRHHAEPDINILTLFGMGFLGAAHGCVGSQKDAPP